MNPDLLIQIFCDDFRQKIQDQSEVLARSLLKALAESQYAFLNAYYTNVPRTFQCMAKLTTGKNKGQRCKYQAKDQKFCGHHLRHLHETVLDDKDAVCKTLNDEKISKNIFSGTKNFSNGKNFQDKGEANGNIVEQIASKTSSQENIIAPDNNAITQVINEPPLPKNLVASKDDTMKQTSNKKMVASNPKVSANTKLANGILYEQTLGEHCLNEKLFRTKFSDEKSSCNQILGEEFLGKKYPDETFSNGEVFGRYANGDQLTSKVGTVYKNMLPVDQLDIISSEINVLIENSDGVVPLVKNYLIPYTYNSLMGKVKKYIGM